MPEDKIQELFARLETGLTQLLESGQWQDYLQTQSRFHKYSFNNILLILCQYPQASKIAGYRTWQELGRQVKKREKAIQILAPIKQKLRRETEEENSQFHLALVGFKKTSVFDISQTEGEELLSVVSPLQGDDAGLSARLITFSQNNGVPVYFKPLETNGYCRFERHTGRAIEIAVKSTLSRLHQAKTLAHEIAHSLLHSRDEYSNHTDTSLAELEAESVAYIVLQHFGLDSSNYSFGYIAVWQQNEKAIEQLKASGSRIQKTANRLIDFLEEQEKIPTVANVCH